MTTFWHYTCDHGRAGITRTGLLLPTTAQVDAEAVATLPPEARPVAALVWLTDLAEPWREALGLTSRISPCDRTRHRYRAVGYQPVRYTAMRRELPRQVREFLESAPGAMPAHWWVAAAPVPVVYDPLVPSEVV